MKKNFFITFFVLLLVSCKSTQGLQFEKLTYHTSACFGRCPTYHMEIGNDKKIRLHSETSYGNGSMQSNPAKEGYFIGTVNDTNYNKLLSELRKVGLDTIKFGGPKCCDGPVKTIIVYYNGKRKYMHAMFPPEHANGLISTLNDIYATSKFERTDLKFEVEKDSVPVNGR